MSRDPFEKPLFIPEVDEPLVIQLPGERVRGLVRGVPDDNTAIVELVVPPLNSKSHRYRMKDYVPCRRRHNGLEEIWEAVDERQMEMAAALKRLQEQQTHEARIEEEERKRKEVADAAKSRKRDRDRERDAVRRPAKAPVKKTEKSANV